MSVCPYCRLSSDLSGLTCPNCGAPARVGEIRDDEGWVEQPPIPDMARIQFGRSQCQISGTTVPVAELSLAAGDQVYFNHHVLLWADPATQLTQRPVDKNRQDRRLAGMPSFMMEAAGPGHIAFSDNEPGEIIAVPLEAGRRVHVSEHHFLAATASVTYDYFNTGIWWVLGTGSEKEYFHPRGRYMDKFTAENERGLLLLHGRGNIFIRDLSKGERIYVQPQAVLYKDRSVDMSIHMERPASPRAHWQVIPLVRLDGPGRLAIQSQYEVEPVEGYGWNELGPDGSWRNWNPDPSRYRGDYREREPLYP
jgi:uncharacterized protein (AIM24 family)